ncbi:MAG: hypothetical protein ACREE6_02255 [Limisphaerales bacterium]
MQEKEIQEQLHEIRNAIGRSDLALADIKNHISQGKISFEKEMASVKSMVNSIDLCGRAEANTIRIDELASKFETILDEMAQLRTAIKRFETALKIPSS